MISFLVAMTKDLTRNNSREEGSLWLTVQRDTAHHHRRNSNAAIGLWYQQGSRRGGMLQLVVFPLFTLFFNLHCDPSLQYAYIHNIFTIKADQFFWKPLPEMLRAYLS